MLHLHWKSLITNAIRDRFVHLFCTNETNRKKGKPMVEKS